MTLPALFAQPLPRFSATRQKRRRVKAYRPAELRPSYILARLGALEESARLDAMGVECRIEDNRIDGMCLVYAGGELVSVCLGRTDE